MMMRWSLVFIGVEPVRPEKARSRGVGRPPDGAATVGSSKCEARSGASPNSFSRSLTIASERRKSFLSETKDPSRRILDEQM